MNEQSRSLILNAMKNQAEWLEDILAGLLINGVSKDEIEVRRFVENHDVQVWVRGKPKYEHRLSITCCGMPL